ncbi:MAG: hypothetical protein JW816_04155 [Candidatus Buchananbacteria bacterium]|nr:hypothetical protein [Candidatus Buchananbacteria bacterium]
MTFRKIFSTITKKEWQFVWLMTLALIILTSLSVIYGYLRSQPNQVFTGMHFVSADDWFVYYSLINQAKTGHLFSLDLYASVVQAPILRPLWSLVGSLAWLFNLPDWAAMNLARIFLIPVFLFIAYLFIAYLFKEKFWRKIALFFLSFSSGLGILFIYRLIKNPLNASRGQSQWPMDLWVPDINTFFSLFTSPHFIAGTILILLIFLATLVFIENQKYFYSILAGLAGLILFSFHPFQVIKVYGVLLCFSLAIFLKNKKINWRLVIHNFIFFLISSPAVLYYLWLMKYDWLTVQRSLQNFCPTTPIYLTIFSFGGLLFFSIFTVYLFWQKKIKFNTNQLFLVVWLLVQFGLLYAPINYQRRTALGVHFPLVVLSVTALVYLYHRYKKWFSRHLVAVVAAGILIFLPSTFFAISADLMVFSQSRELSYITVDESNALLWLKFSTKPDSVILSSEKTGKLIPAYALRFSYVGHPVETPFYNQKKSDPVWYFSNQKSASQQRQFLQEQKIDYVFYGPQEKLINPDWSADQKYLKLIYHNQSVDVYQVL